MDTSVETRKGIVKTVVFNQLLSAAVAFVFQFVFQWLYNMNTGIIVYFTLTSVFYITGIYSYVYDQPKLDLILKKKYDFLMPLKTGGFAALIIFITSGVHFIIGAFSDSAAALYGFIAKLINYSFFYFLYGRDGNYYNISALIFFILLPIVVSYFAYYMGIKKYSIAKVYTRTLYKRKNNE